MEKKFDILGSAYRKLNKNQVIQLKLDLDGEYFLPHSKKVYEDIVSRLEILEISEFLKDEPLQKLLIKEVEYLGLVQVYEFIIIAGGIKDKYHSLFIEELEKLKYIVLDELKRALDILKQFNFFNDKVTKIHPLTGKSVLLVEDLPYNRLIINKILSKYKVHLKEVENGQMALEEWHKNRNYDLILMDMNMPVMDGFSATKEIRKIEQDSNLNRVPIIALTALAMVGDQEKCMQAGCDEYLSKPIDSAVLINLCAQQIQQGDQSEDDKSEQFTIKLDRVLLKTANDIYHATLKKILSRFGIDIEIVAEQDLLLEKIARTTYDLIILDPDFDLQLAFYVKKLYPYQFITFILNEKYKKELLYNDELENLKFPFKSKEIIKILEAYSLKIQSNKRKLEELKDVHSLESVKSQYKLDETIAKSDQQLAVWQKSFRKIGGDLILSHQFNYHGRFGLVLADVAGHDIKSGYTATWFSGLIKGIWDKNSNPLDLLMYLNKLFDHDTEEEDKRFVCALALLWDRIRSKLYYANAGIPGGLLVRKGSDISEQLNWKGIPIGLFADVEMFDHGAVDFYRGDRLYIATDGVLEAIPNDVFQNISNNQSDQPVSEALDAIVDFTTRSIEVTDDLTIAAFEAQALPEISNGFRESIQSTFEGVDRMMKKTENFITSYHLVNFDWALISVAFREGLLNALQHGNKNQSQAPIDIDVVIEGKILIVIISDTGGGFDYSSVKSQLAEEGTLRIHGRGLEIIENIAHSFSYHGGGVKMEFTAIE
jgi:CheY-like chemotaxis protein/serine phosphatase RsbU (regulator of sigma subunit)/anti-sigma regulatory factor (Ser/Thr protein kinase)